jgi:predicted acetyltransferase
MDTTEILDVPSWSPYRREATGIYIVVFLNISRLTPRFYFKVGYDKFLKHDFWLITAIITNTAQHAQPPTNQPSSLKVRHQVFMEALSLMQNFVIFTPQVVLLGQWS